MSCKDWTAVVRTPSGRLEHVDFRSVSINRGDAIAQAKANLWYSGCNSVSEDNV